MLKEGPLGFLAFCAVACWIIVIGHHVFDMDAFDPNKYTIMRNPLRIAWAGVVLSVLGMTAAIGYFLLRR